MYARKTTEEAKKVSLCFQAIGIRTWIQTELGWKQEQPQLTLEDIIALANFASSTAQNAGVSKALAESIKFSRSKSHEIMRVSAYQNSIIITKWRSALKCTIITKAYLVRHIASEKQQLKTSPSKVFRYVFDLLKLDSVMQIAPEAKPLLLPQKEAIAECR